MTNLVLGLDIGLAGAVAVLDQDGALIAVEDMPALSDGTAKRRTINPALLADILRQHTPVVQAFVEYVAARPGEGAVGAFAFGRCRGIVEGVCGALAIPTSLITPAHWKHIVGLPPGTNKDASRSTAIVRWPGKVDLFRRKMDNGRSDAALIAIAGMMKAHQKRLAS